MILARARAGLDIDVMHVILAAARRHADFAREVHDELGALGLVESYAAEHPFP
jgi:uncharacterized protein YbaA (DUF1428 family)